MLTSLFTIILSLFGISFLVFIHELGHYFMARRAGITVEVFSIGFGKPFWQRERDGVKWQICWIPFGGYVKMAGMEKTGGLEPHQIEGGFFAAKPGSRIKVALMGPIVNILFALLAFSFLWMMGGREKSFSEFTSYIGWIDKDAGLYKEGIRPGDTITKLNGRPFTGFKDLLYGAVLDDRALMMSGQEIDYLTGDKTPYTYTFSGERSEDGMERFSSIAREMSSAQYLIYDRNPNGAPNKLLPSSPLEGSGITYGDRIVWVDGVLVFSQKELSQLVNAPKVLVSVEREGKILTTRVPRLQVQDLRLTGREKEELDDWADSAKLKTRIDEVMFIPYSLNTKGVVQRPHRYIDEKSQAKELYEAGERIPSEESLLPGDRIVAVQGVKVDGGIEALKELQTKKVLVIVKKVQKTKPVSWKKVDDGFETSFDVADIETIVHSFGTGSVVSESGSLALLKPIIPVMRFHFPLSEEEKSKEEEKYAKWQKQVEEIEDPNQRAIAEANLELSKKRLMLGVTLQDKMVAYNPQPFVLLVDVFKETYRTFLALITGYLSPKYMSGPVGIIQVIQQSWTVGAKEALYWLGLISLNLGIFNLLPIPILDGGHICFALWESVTKKPISAKTMERLMIPFVVLIIAFFVYLTYHDIVRIFKSLF